MYIYHNIYIYDIIIWGAVWNYLEFEGNKLMARTHKGINMPSIVEFYCQSLGGTVGTNRWHMHACLELLGVSQPSNSQHLGFDTAGYQQKHFLPR